MRRIVEGLEVRPSIAQELHEATVSTLSFMRFALFQNCT